MRIEKGHPAGGELNGQTTARDLGLGKMLSAKKDFIGRVMAARPALTAPERPSLVGLRPVDRGERLRAGAHLIPKGAEAAAGNDQGYMTSVAFSPTLGHWIGLGLLARGPERIGERVRAYDPVRGGDVRSRCARPASSIRKGSASVSDRHLRPLSALAGVASPGRFGKASGEPGVSFRSAAGLGSRRSPPARVRRRRSSKPSPMAMGSSFPTAPASRMDRR